MPAVRTGLGVGVLHGLALLDGWPGPDPMALGFVRAALVLAGFVVLARWLTTARGTVDPARAGFAYGTAFGIVALHWVPAAAAPWFGTAGGLVAGVTVWSLHGALAAIGFDLVARAGARVGTGVALIPGWIVVEWLPGAVPLIHLPRPPMAAALVGLPGIAPVVAVVGAFGLSAILAGCVGSLVECATAGRRQTSGSRAAGPSTVHSSKGREPLLPPLFRRGLPLAILMLVVAVGLLRPEGADRGRPMELVIAQIPMDRSGLVDPEQRADQLQRSIRIGPADLWPESVLPDAPVRPAGTNLGAPLVGVRTLGRDPAHNALARIEADGSIRVVHRKQRLVPVVERTRILNPGRGDAGLSPGPPPTSFRLADRRVGALICFEVLFPASVAALRRGGATLLLHAANDAMLAPGAGVPILGRTPLQQQERILALRAIETGMPVVRSSMGDRSLGLDRDGELLSRTEVPGSGGQRWRVQVPAAVEAPPAVALAGRDGPVALALLLLVAIVPAVRTRRGGGTGGTGGTQGGVEG